MTSFCVEFEKVGHRLLQDDFRREGECVVSRKSGGKKKGSVLENAVNIEVIEINIPCIAVIACYISCSDIR